MKIKLLLILLLVALLGCSDITQVNITPQITTFSPLFLDLNGGQTLTIEGHNFKKNDTIKLGSRLICNNLTFISSKKITCITPATSEIDTFSISISRDNKDYPFEANKIRYAIVLGAPSTTTIHSGVAKSFNGPTDVKKINGKLYFSNSGLYKLNILNAEPSQNYPDFDSVFGQQNLYTTGNFNDTHQVNGYTGRPYHFDSDGVHFAIADDVNHRVLIWNTIPTSSTQPADIVLGQPDFISNEANNGGISASSLSQPRSVHFYNGKLIVADSANHRVLIWNSIPQANNFPSDIVVGQTVFTSNGYNKTNTTTPSSSSLYSPSHAAVLNGNLVISDTANNRVLIYNGIPNTSDPSAQIVLGQTNFTTRTINQGGRSAQSLYSPRKTFFDGTKFYVVDTSNNRVLIWNSFPSINKEAANLVIGQADFTTGSTAATASNLLSPLGVSVIDNKIYLTDSGNNRVLVYNSIPSSNGVNADLVIGQPNFTSSLARNPNSDSRMVNVMNVTTDGVRIVVADMTKNRTLIWNNIPSSNSVSPDIVLGQNDLTTSGPTVGTNTGFRNPTSAAIVGDKLIIADSLNHRILIWNSWPTTNNQSADVVLGQASFAGGTANRGGAVSGITLNTPHSVFSDGTRLIVSDKGNNRVLIWNSLPVDNSIPADIVIGQPDISSSLINNGGVSASSLASPRSARIFNDKLYIADRDNYRLLVFQTIPTTHGAAADLVLGQDNFISNELYKGSSGPAADTLTPADTFVDSNSLYVVEDNTNRIVKFDIIPTSNGQSANSYIGQSTLSLHQSAHVNGFGWPNGMTMTGDKILVADYLNGRILIIKK